MKFTVRSPLGVRPTKRGLTEKIGSPVNRVWANMNMDRGRGFSNRDRGPPLSSRHAPKKSAIYKTRRSVDPRLPQVAFSLGHTPRNRQTGKASTSLKDLDRQMIEALVKKTMTGASPTSIRRLAAKAALSPEMKKLIISKSQPDGPSATGLGGFGEYEAQKRKNRIQNRREMQRVLDSQVAEKRAREQSAKRRRAEWELNKDREIHQFLAFGRAGGGAPLKTQAGEVVSSFKDLKTLAARGNAGDMYQIRRSPLTPPRRTHILPSVSSPGDARPNFLGAISQMHHPVSRSTANAKERQRKKWLADLDKQCREREAEKAKKKAHERMREQKDAAEYERWRSNFHQQPHAHVDLTKSTSGPVALVPRETPPNAERSTGGARALQSPPKLYTPRVDATSPDKLGPVMYSPVAKAAPPVPAHLDHYSDPQYGSLIRRRQRPPKPEAGGYSRRTSEAEGYSRRTSATTAASDSTDAFFNEIAKFAMDLGPVEAGAAQPRMAEIPDFDPESILGDFMTGGGDTKF